MADLLDEFKMNLDFYFSEALNRPLAKPYWVFFSLSHRCNFNCQMCGVRHVLKDCELELELVKRILDEVAAWGTDCTVLFTGGEVFLRKDIFQILRYSVSRGLKTEVVTNGSLIDTPAIADNIIASGISNIAVSLDGATQKTHDYIRGTPGAYLKAVNALNLLCQAKRIKQSGPQISIWTTMMKENVDELYAIIFLAKEIGVECLVYHPVIVAQNDMQNTISGGHLWITQDLLDAFKKQIDKIEQYRNESGLVASLHDPYLWLGYFQGKLTRKDWKCNPFVFVDIGPDGFVRSCGPAFGNIRQMSLTDCLHTKEAEDARQRMRLCLKPCLQTCWGHPESDSLKDIVDSFIGKVTGTEAGKSEKKALLAKGLALLEDYDRLASGKRE